MIANRISVVKADITTIEADAIVNAANSSLLGGGGVDGAIHRAGGKEILEECLRIIQNQGECKTGDAVITTAGKLPAKYVIHTVGPVWYGGGRDEAAKLASAYRSSLELAVKNDVKTIAFPNISTGVYLFPKAIAADIAVNEVKTFLKGESGFEIEKVTFVCYDDENLSYYLNILGAKKS